jgi:glycosyltransferase involved in cell wall biosynthesis
MQDNPVTLSVVAPVYNEKDVIEQVVRYWLEVLEKDSITYEIVLGDGGSNDGTLEILQSLSDQYPNLRITHAPQPSGYGNALFSAIYGSKGQYVVMLDSDGQFDLADYRELLEKVKAGNLDTVTGFRIRKQDSFIRYFADRVLNVIVRVIFWINQKDTNCALKVFKGDIIRDMHIEARAWPTPTEIMIRLKARGCKVGEVPIQHHRREGGETKLRVFKTGFEFFVFLIYMRLKLRLYKKLVINRIYLQCHLAISYAAKSP